MASDSTSVQEVRKQLSAHAHQVYGTFKARDLATQINQTASALAAVGGYPLATETEPWTASNAPAIRREDGRIRA